MFMLLLFIIMMMIRNGTFDPATKHTIGVEFATKELVIKNKNVKAQIWDTAGQERYRAITKAYYRGAVGALIVYDITDRETFDSLKRWLSEVQANSDPSIKLMLVGNKCDLVEKRKVHIDEGKAFAEQHGLSFVEASAFNGDAVEDAFDHLMGKIFDQQIARIKTFQAEQLSIPSSSSSGSSNKDGSKISKGESIQLEKIDAELRGKKLGISQSSGCCT